MTTKTIARTAAALWVLGTAAGVLVENGREARPRPPEASRRPARSDADTLLPLSR